MQMQFADSFRYYWSQRHNSSSFRQMLRQMIRLERIYRERGENNA